MASVRYIGPFDQVSLEPDNLPAQVVDRNGVIEVPDELAAHLCTQADWEPAKASKKSAPVDPAPAA